MIVYILANIRVDKKKKLECDAGTIWSAPIHPPSDIPSLLDSNQFFLPVHGGKIFGAPGCNTSRTHLALRRRAQNFHDHYSCRPLSSPLIPGHKLTLHALVFCCRVPSFESCGPLGTPTFFKCTSVFSVLYSRVQPSSEYVFVIY